MTTPSKQGRGRRRAGGGRLVRLVSTHVTKEVGDQLAEKVARTGLSESAYVRQLLLTDLGLI